MFADIDYLQVVFLLGKVEISKHKNASRNSLFCLFWEKVAGIEKNKYYSDIFVANVAWKVNAANYFFKR